MYEVVDEAIFFEFFDCGFEFGIGGISEVRCGLVGDGDEINLFPDAFDGKFKKF